MPGPAPTPGSVTYPGQSLVPGGDVVEQLTPAYARQSSGVTAESAWPFLGGTVYADRAAGRIP